MMKELTIGNKTAKIPVIQGGMGVGVSRSKLAGAVAAEGGIGVISTAQIGYDERDFDKNQKECNKRAIESHVKRGIGGGRLDQRPDQSFGEPVHWIVGGRECYGCAQGLCRTCENSGKSGR